MTKTTKRKTPYTGIPVKVVTKEELIKRKLKFEAGKGKKLTWDEYLLAKC